LPAAPVIQRAGAITAAEVAETAPTSNAGAGAIHKNSARTLAHSHGGRNMGESGANESGFSRITLAQQSLSGIPTCNLRSPCRAAEAARSWCEFDASVGARFPPGIPSVSADMRVCECNASAFLSSAEADAIFSRPLVAEEWADPEAASSHFHSVMVRNAGGRCDIAPHGTRRT
jgi:hypothetical protein